MGDCETELQKGIRDSEEAAVDITGFASAEQHDQGLTIQVEYCGNTGCLGSIIRIAVAGSSLRTVLLLVAVISGDGGAVVYWFPRSSMRSSW